MEIKGKVAVITGGSRGIGKTTALVDGNKVTLDVPPQIINDRTYIPLRFVSEHLGGSVNWDEKTQTVTIYYWP